MPGIYDGVAPRLRSRCARWTATARCSEFEAEGLLAVCIQHEMDHLLGKVFVEYLSPLKRNRIKTKMLKKARDESGSRLTRGCADEVAFAGTPEFAQVALAHLLPRAIAFRWC